MNRAHVILRLEVEGGSEGVRGRMYLSSGTQALQCKSIHVSFIPVLYAWSFLHRIPARLHSVVYIQSS